jgi:hypothetical protein
MMPYVYEPLKAGLRDCMRYGLVELRFTLEAAIGYTMEDMNVLPHKGSDPIWTTLNFTALYAVALENRLEAVALENKFEGVPKREIERFWGEEVRKYCINEAVVAAALDPEERDAFLADIVQVRAALKV